jgi:hypothetical protein
MNEEKEFSSIKEGFKEGFRISFPKIDWGRIKRDIENAARAAREFAERTAREARERTERLARETADRIARETRERIERERIAAEKRAQEIAEKIRLQQLEDARRYKLALEGQIASLSKELSKFRGVETDFLQQKSKYDALLIEYNLIKSNYEAELKKGDDFRANVNSADDASIVAIEDKQNVYDIVTKLYIDSTKKPIDIYNQIVEQNRILDEKIRNLKDSFTTDDQKVFYENQQYEYLVKIRTILYYFYYFLVIIFFFILFIHNRNDNVSKIWKAVLLLLFIVYPYAIGIIEKTIYTVFLFMYAIVNGDAYMNNY